MKKALYLGIAFSSATLFSGCSSTLTSIPNALPLGQQYGKPTITLSGYRPRISYADNSNGSRYSRVSYHDSLQSSKRREMMKVAHRSLGNRYKWGGETPREGFDCSGLMQYTYKQTGIRIPRTAAQQRDASRRITRSQLRPGDMIFFKTGRNSNHVGIYTGDGEFIHASTSSRRVKKEKLDTSYWNRHLVKYGTFL